MKYSAVNVFVWFSQGGRALPALIGNVVNHAVCDSYSVPASCNTNAVGDDIHRMNCDLEFKCEHH